MTDSLANDPIATSTWSDTVKPGEIADADAFIEIAESAGHWPIDVRKCQVQAVDGDTALKAPGASAIVGEYHDGSRKVLGINGGRYKVTSPDQWRALVRAAVAAGGQPVGSHAWDGKVMAQFDVGGNGLRTNLLLGDSFDGSCKLVAGTLVIRVGCANAMHRAVRKASAEFCQIRHTASLDEKVAQLRDGIAQATAEGQRIAELFDAASRIHLPPAAAKLAFDTLFKVADLSKCKTDRAKQRATTVAENMRAAARQAAKLACNQVGSRGNVATLWNAATYLVDRNADGSQRPCKGSASMVDSMLLGSRGERVEEVGTYIESLVEVIKADGSGFETMTVADAVDAGALDGAQIVDQILGLN
jgi:hypothetical protein